MLLRLDLLFPLAVFCAVTDFTPGPNNTMLMNAGLNFGMRRAMPHLLGVALGYLVLVVCVGVGLGIVFTTFPAAYVVLKYLSAIYILYLAWKIATAAVPKPHTSQQKKPLTFLQAAAFQWINPKGWTMAVGAFATYANVAFYPWNVLIVVGLFGVFGLASAFTWVGLGSMLQKFLHKPKLVHAFNIAMALLLVASLYPLFTEAMQP